tara:strand:- start:83 stop:454 length:372 start_codon:yes stop_codon:yes gene_type:complete
MYYNTTNLTGEELYEEIANSLTQEQLILHIYNVDLEELDFGIGPEGIRETCLDFYNKDWPITSIRRAINTLTKAGKLTKTNELRRGRYGKNEHVWKCNTEGYTPQICNDINDTDTPGQGSGGF